jgi:hypothetical protein
MSAFRSTSLRYTNRKPIESYLPKGVRILHKKLAFGMTCPAGRYKGKKVEAIYLEDRGYFEAMAAKGMFRHPTPEELQELGQ